MHCNKYLWKHGMELCKLPHWCFFSSSFLDRVDTVKQANYLPVEQVLIVLQFDFFYHGNLSEQNHKIVKRWKNPKSQNRNFEYWNMWCKLQLLMREMSKYWKLLLCGLGFLWHFMNSTEKENNTFCKVTTSYAFFSLLSFLCWRKRKGHIIILTVI